MEAYRRKTTGVCPQCRSESAATVTLAQRRAVLEIHCKTHENQTFVLSENGEEYLELDRYFHEFLHSRGVDGEISNYWLLVTDQCQMNCDFCQTEISKPFFSNMESVDIEKIYSEKGTRKLTLSGGEPSLHPEITKWSAAAARQGVHLQLATNGLRLASPEFCRSLKASGIHDVRISVESLHNRHEAKTGGNWTHFHESKIKALENLEREGIATVISPTIFKGLNENLLTEAIQFAGSRPFVRELSVNGFSWAGDGEKMDREYMIMPDQMMDIIAAKYMPGKRHDLFVLQKFVYALLYAMNIRICLYTQFVIFVRARSGIKPITEFLAMKRLEFLLGLWETCSARRGKTFKRVLLFLLLPIAVKLRSFTIALPMLRFLFLSKKKLDTNNIPRNFLPVVLNTNCSVLTLDDKVSEQCMSAVIFKKNGELFEKKTTDLLKQNGMRILSATDRPEK